MPTPLPRRKAGSARRAPLTLPSLGAAPLLYAFAANALTPANAPTPTPANAPTPTPANAPTPTPATPHIFCTAPTSATAAWAIRVIPAQSWALTSL